RRPISGISYLIGAASLVAFPPLGCFWTLTELADRLWQTHPWLVGVMLIVNSLTAFSLTREFCLIFAGKIKQMTVRSPEGLWLVVLPMTLGLGLALHAPILLYKWGLLPQVSNLNVTIAGAFTLTTLVGAGSASIIYLNESITKPIQLKPKAVQDFFAYDLYTEKFYRLTIISVVGIVSQIVYWCDRYLVDGVINLFGLATIFSGESLRYNTSGQTQFYFLSILLGVFLFVGIICSPWFFNYL
ncbi:MAG: hypothetical protein RLZZ381_2124, partial [Cyanobacteriota bacterium]